MDRTKLLSGLAVAMVLLVYILYLSISLTRPIIFGDEGFHAAVSKLMRDDATYHKWYPLFYDTADAKGGFVRPPLLYMIFSGFALAGWNEFIIKMVIPLFSVLTALLLFLWIRDLVSAEAGLFAAFLFLMIPSQVTYAVLFYSDGLFLLMVMASLLFFHKFIKTEKPIFLTLTAVFTSLSLLTKTSGPIMLLFLLLYPFMTTERKKFLMAGLKVLIVVFILMTPWFVRNFALYGSPTCDNFPIVPGFFSSAGCNFGAPEQSSQEFSGRAAEVGSEAELIKFGLLNFFAFSYGNPLLILLLVGGIALCVINRNNYFSVPLVFLLSSLVLFKFATGRVEDAARYVLPVVIPVSVVAAIYASKLISFEKKHFKYAGIIIILIFAALVAQPGLAKVSVMSSVKQFSPAFVEANQWLKLNTAKDSVVLSLWTAATVYHSERRAMWSVAELGDILLTNTDEKVLPPLKKHGVNYILVAKFSISDQAYQQTYPIQFVNYLQSSNHFKNVFENTDTVVFQVV